MTKAQARKKFNELLKTSNESAKKRLEEALDSGLVNFSAVENNYRLPKKLLCTILHNEADEWVFSSTKREAEALRKVI